MKTFFALLLVATSVAVAQLAKPTMLNPARIKATETVREGSLTRYRGEVTIDLRSLTVSCGELDYRAADYQMTTRGDVRMVLNKDATDYKRISVTDPRRFKADDVQQDGDLMTLSGKVILSLPGWQILAQDAVVDRSKATIAIRGETTLIALKPPIEGVRDDLGPVFLTLAPAETAAGK